MKSSEIIQTITKVLHLFFFKNSKITSNSSARQYIVYKNTKCFEKFLNFRCGQTIQHSQHCIDCKKKGVDRHDNQCRMAWPVLIYYLYLNKTPVNNIPPPASMSHLSSSTNDPHYPSTTGATAFLSGSRQELLRAWVWRQHSILPRDNFIQHPTYQILITDLHDWPDFLNIYFFFHTIFQIL